MEIEIGEYVRIKHMYNETKIAKIKAILSKDPCYKDMQMYEIDVVHQHSNGHFKSHKIYEEDIIKHSKNIIELIEVDDIGIMNCYGLKVKKFITKDDILELKCRNYELLSIITKEPIKQIEYRIKE